ncbi:phage tail protein [Arhodomonas sp. AD133]|uniref:phage tail protein n=1 Tax=Arhodomonas sp. AD133 TaxID=3415009 RepID=UPI003EB7E8C3
MAANRYARIDGLAEVRSALGKAGSVSRKAARLAINDTARRMRTAGSKAIREQVNLKAKYVNDRLRITEKATDDSPFAIISGRRRETRLDRYGAKQLTRKAKHPSRSEGDPLRGIPAGKKAAGISVKVKRGGPRKKMRGAFFIPLKDSGGLGVATRTGKGKNAYEVEHGPSVHQVWRDVREDLAPEAEERLNSEFQRQLKRLL